MKDKKATVEDTAHISIQPFRHAATYVSQTGLTIEGELPFLGEDHALRLTSQGSNVELTIDEFIIVLEPVESRLVPSSIAQWYFRCPECQRRCKDLYRPTLDDDFSCRLCHDLTYRSSQEQHKNEALYKFIGAETGMYWTLVRDIAGLMAPGWED